VCRAYGAELSETKYVSGARRHLRLETAWMKIQKCEIEEAEAL
jgi:hypothetical protein